MSFFTILSTNILCRCETVEQTSSALMLSQLKCNKRYIKYMPSRAFPCTQHCSVDIFTNYINTSFFRPCIDIEPF